ncbi:MAG TPA: hypothetical protein VMM35_13320 [Longimicrobiales bacterium]|nr:hypothetical protein [Longimicrobiales bacterium]
MTRIASLIRLTVAFALAGASDVLAQATVDPGTGPWTLLDEDEVAEVCRLDYDALEGAMIPATASFAVVRYGRLCFVSGPDASAGAVVTHNWSATKTLGALLTGMVMYETRDLPESSARMKGPFRELDRMDKWLDLSALPAEADIHPDATVAHVLAMVGYSDDLSHGQKRHVYDGDGEREINYLIDALDNVVRQDTERFGVSAVSAKNRLFSRLGFEHSSWDVERFGYTWYGSLLDMARLGLVLIHGGVYGGGRIADAEYVYNMTHPAFEDGSTRYGYLTWMNGTRCSPRAIHASYPHGLSEATDCADGDCDQEYDVGVWYAYGANGQYIIGHRGLDMVVVGKNWGNGNEDALWEAVLPAVVAADPVFNGDQAAFCEAYARGSYAPDLVPWTSGP